MATWDIEPKGWRKTRLVWRDGVYTLVRGPGKGRRVTWLGAGRSVIHEFVWGSGSDQVWWNGRRDGKLAVRALRSRPKMVLDFGAIRERGGRFAVVTLSDSGQWLVDERAAETEWIPQEVIKLLGIALEREPELSMHGRLWDDRAALIWLPILGRRMSGGYPIRVTWERER